MEYNESDERISFFDVIEEGDEDICRSMWLGVILQAVLDAKGKYGNTVTQAHAKVWLEGREGLKSDFAAVCSLAGVDFERTRSRCIGLLQQEKENIDFRAMKKDKSDNRTASNRKRYFRRAERNQKLRHEVAARALQNHAENDNHPQPSNDNAAKAYSHQSLKETAYDQ